MQAQTCKPDTSFAAAYYYPEEEVGFHFGTMPTSDNGTLIISQSSGRSTRKTGILITKVKQDGMTDWAKKIEAQFSNIAGMVSTSTGYVFALNSFTETSGDVKHLFFFCINNDGELLWQYKYSVPNIVFEFELVQLQDAGNGSIDVSVSCVGSVHDSNSGTSGDFFYFQIDNFGQPVTKAFVFDGSYNGYDFFSELMGINHYTTNQDKISLFVMHDMEGGRAIRTYPSFCNNLFGYSNLNWI